MNWLSSFTSEQWETLAALDNIVPSFGLVEEVGHQLGNQSAQRAIDSLQRIATSGSRHIQALGMLRGVLLPRLLRVEFVTPLPLPTDTEWPKIISHYNGLPLDKLALAEEVGIRSGDWDAQDFVDSVFRHDVPRGLAGGNLGGTHTLGVLKGVIMSDVYLQETLGPASAK